jgi:hypothetical protein
MKRDRRIKSSVNLCTRIKKIKNNASSITQSIQNRIEGMNGTAMKLMKEILFTLFLIVSITAAQSLTPAEKVTAFLNKYQSMKFSGLPNAEDAKILSTFLSVKLNKQIQKAWIAQQKFKSKYPDEKPPLVEGDLFSSLFEGATSFEIMGTKIKLNNADVAVKFKNVSPAENNNPVEWTDNYKLIKNKNGWFIDDLKYQGKWDFAPKGLLSKTLNETIKDAE